VTVLTQRIYAVCVLLCFANFRCFDPYKSTEWQLILNSKLFRKVKAISFPLVTLILFPLRSVETREVYTNKTPSLTVPWPKWLVTGLLQSSHRFDPKPLHVGCGGNRSTEAGFSSGVSASPCHYHSSNAPYSVTALSPKLYILSN
jgi:hypothetical protein